MRLALADCCINILLSRARRQYIKQRYNYKVVSFKFSSNNEVSSTVKQYMSLYVTQWIYLLDREVKKKVRKTSSLKIMLKLSVRGSKNCILEFCFAIFIC